MQPGPRRWTAWLPLGCLQRRSEPDLSRELLATPMESDHKNWFAARRSTSSVRVSSALVAPTPSAGGVRGIVRVSTEIVMNVEKTAQPGPQHQHVRNKTAEKRNAKFRTKTETVGSALAPRRRAHPTPATGVVRHSHVPAAVTAEQPGVPAKYEQYDVGGSKGLSRPTCKRKAAVWTWPRWPWRASHHHRAPQCSNACPRQ